MSKKSLTVFFSYSHKDELLRDELAKHLSLLQRDGTISAWHDRQISAGTEWANDIDANLNAADLILLLISSDFLASDYCHQVELKRAIERHDRGEARVIPIILRPCRWQSAWFSKLQLLPKNGEPVTKWADRDDAFTNIVEGIERAIGEMLKSPAVPVAPPLKPPVQNIATIAEPTSKSPLAPTFPVQWQEIKKNPVELVSAKGMDYRELEKLLKAQEWRKADELTVKYMLKVANRESRGWLDEDSIKIFPCKDLRTIEQLWVHYSNSKFGFSIQKKIWLECGGEIGKYDYEVWKKFAAKVGWYHPQNNDWRSYTEFMNDTKNAQNALPASLPKVFGMGFGGFGWLGVGLFFRVETCEL
jgi:hypothetical protein